MGAAIVIDSSAIIAIIRGEPEAPAFSDVIDRSKAAICSMVTFAESYMVATGRFAGTPPHVHLALIRSLGIDTKPIDDGQALLAADAFFRFGKGRHPAKLNMGDCFSYALAKSVDAPLLYKGDDFGRTDIASALTRRG